MTPRDLVPLGAHGSEHSMGPETFNRRLAGRVPGGSPAAGLLAGLFGRQHTQRHGPAPRWRPGRRAGRRSAYSATRAWISPMSNGLRSTRMTPGSFANHSGSTSADITTTS